MKTKFSQNANFKDLLKRNQNAIVDAALNVTILFSALTRMFPKPTFAP